ncbi:putative transcription factor C3H family [Helianthus annuus]|uniref:Transcription factor C3H family n=2 Tax=Helianthus annuus TaxID=4232 RepID=A0A9K3J7B9_HELAN|nr:zinc finger CCCH domain-containing protein 66 [Helianthus annuus]KAF5809731.1 putative transcription factor C3H family [Helianthus annuus]KAJ0580706.1 putative transcription factor C3H family [Helianthus annuus]KAJ0588357.1 putative transcription factor C3H family [Helianthus annuus]KAJ0596656.1 putative transcription factor C3H family [Helianthus annuus]KAJ0757323.1 putative transcription factor C3H family [Helianthus annuus]
MCTGDLIADHSNGPKHDITVTAVSVLLELSAADNLEQFRSLVEQEGLDVNESGLWYGRTLGSKKMKLEERTPLMIASMFGSKQVLNFILGLNGVDVNKCCGSDRATALHLAVAGGSTSCVEVVKLLIDGSADTNCLDVHGNRPVDLIPFAFGSSFNSRRKLLELVLNGYSDDQELLVLNDLSDNLVEEQKVSPILIKKEYPVDLSLPDMKNGIYNTDEFRMYAFKIKPCSRAYSHDWTECPFVHPGENARRRDPRKYHYSCVPCPEFRKGSCRQGDNCEYAHGIFECWLHPAQYRTRLCKDEVGCSRKVCFFAHKPEELRPLHPSTGSAVLSPRSLYDVSSVSPFSIGSPSIMVPRSSTPPITPGASSPRNTLIWSNQSPPTTKVLGSRFRMAPSGQDLDLETELMMVDRYRQQQLIDELARLSPPSSWNNNSGFPSEYFEEYETVNGSNRINPLHQSMNYSSGLPSSPLRMSSFGANQIMNSRAAAFAKRSQSFIDRGAVNRQSASSVMAPSTLSGWSSPDGKLNWGIQKDELSKLRKSASFGVHRSPDPLSIPNNQDPDITFDDEQHFSPLLDQEQLVA